MEKDKKQILGKLKLNKLSENELEKAAPMWHAWIGAFFCPVLFSGCVELLQEYCTTYRGGDWLDFAANATGAVLASLVAYYVVRPRILKR